MTTLSQDPKGYYAVLGLAPGAAPTAVKTAYRTRVKAVHPDRNRSEGAAEEFQRLVEAYHILRDVVRKAEYDAGGALGIAEDDPSQPAVPLACGCCGKVTAQPRYVVFQQVKSYLVWALRQRVEGIFCRDCADRAAVRASTVTWTLGWWSLPGLVLAPLTLIRNLLGGVMPKRDNARLLLRQARAFYERGEPEVARALAVQASPFIRETGHRRAFEDLMRKTSGGGRLLRDRWKTGGGAFTAQLMPLAALPLVLAMFVLIWFKPWGGPVAAGAAGIKVAPAMVGEIRHVAVDELKVREQPSDTAPVLALIDRFTTVTVADAPEDAQWTQVRTPSGITGWVPSRALYVGTGGSFKTEWCAQNAGSRPESGEVLMRRAGGDNRLLVHNDGRFDAVVKLKTQAGSTVVAYFVPATYHIAVTGIPEGTFLIEFATGRTWSRACGLFSETMSAGRLPFTLTFRHLSSARAASSSTIPEVSLVTPAGDLKAPHPIEPARFAADD